MGFTQVKIWCGSDALDLAKGSYLNTSINLVCSNKVMLLHNMDPVGERGRE